ncbi:MAG TPA: tetratricopeptide repeat protein [Steroidobacteraceae bacterium]|nr:tetratricopeptide repeat protein [Steroidobacteraceae bacterium]
MVEDYLTDRDQEEALRNWWRENWKWLLAGVVLGLGLLAGWQFWQKYRGQQAEHAATVYAGFQKALAGNDVAEAGRLLNSLSGEHASSAYTQQGRLLLAKRETDAGKFDEAIKHLREVVDKSKDAELGQIARVRLARLLIQTGKHDEALQMLDVEKAGNFAPQVREIRGDALVAKGDAQGARAEYAAALAAQSDGQIDRANVELKLRDVGGEVPTTPAPAAPATKGDS